MKGGFKSVSLVFIKGIIVNVVYDSERRGDKVRYKVYRNIDLIIFGILLVFSSLVSLFLFSNKSFQYYFSFTVLILFIILVRWNYLGLIPYVISQFILSIVQIYFFKTDVTVTLCANLGSCLFLFVLPLIFIKSKLELRKRPFLLVSFLILTYLLIGLGQGVCFLFLGDFNFIGNFMFYIFNVEIYSIVISIILILLLRTIDNLIVNVDEHLKMIQKEEDEKWMVLENDKKSE